MARLAASYLVLHCLPMSHKKDAMLIGLTAVDNAKSHLISKLTNIVLIARLMLNSESLTTFIILENCQNISIVLEVNIHCMYYMYVKCAYCMIKTYIFCFDLY